MSDESADGGPGTPSVGSKMRVSTFRGLLFFTAYAPVGILFGLLTIPNFVRAGLWIIVSLLLAVSCALVLLLRTRKIGGISLELSDVSDQGDAVSGYLATYLLPFVATTVWNTATAIAVLGYFAIAFVVHMRSSTALVNPTLYCFGWRLSTARLGGSTVIVLHRSKIASEASFVKCDGFLIEARPN